MNDPADAQPRVDGERRRRSTVGAGDSWRGTRIHYVRREGVDATYAVAQAKLQPLFEAM
jgi:hypothetical protein